MTSIEDRKQQREQFLVELYREVGDAAHARTNRTITAKIGLAEPDAYAVADYVVKEGYANWAAMGGTIETLRVMNVACRPHSDVRLEFVYARGLRSVRRSRSDRRRRARG